MIFYKLNSLGLGKGDERDIYHIKTSVIIFMQNKKWERKPTGEINKENPTGGKKNPAAKKHITRREAWDTAEQKEKKSREKEEEKI